MDLKDDRLFWGPQLRHLCSMLSALLPLKLYKSLPESFVWGLLFQKMLAPKLFASSLLNVLLRRLR